MDADASRPDPQAELFAAVVANEPERIERSIAAGADARERDSRGMTLLMLAAYEGSLAALCALLPHSDVSATDPEHGSSALECAAIGGAPDCVEILLAAGADPDAPGAFGRSPLSWAAGSGVASCLPTLLAASDPRLVDPARGRDALMHAADSGFAVCVSLLLPHCDPRAVDFEGLDAARIAEAKGHQEAARLIRAELARLDAQELGAALPPAPPGRGPSSL